MDQAHQPIPVLGPPSDEYRPNRWRSRVARQNVLGSSTVDSWDAAKSIWGGRLWNGLAAKAFHFGFVAPPATAGTRQWEAVACSRQSRPVARVTATATVGQRNPPAEPAGRECGNGPSGTQSRRGNSPPVPRRAMHALSLVHETQPLWARLEPGGEAASFPSACFRVGVANRKTCRAGPKPSAGL